MLHEKEATTLPEGFVIANDIDPKRCYMLVHQSRRIHSPCCLVTNHDAAAFPDINIKQVVLQCSVHSNISHAVPILIWLGYKQGETLTETLNTQLSSLFDQPGLVTLYVLYLFRKILRKLYQCCLIEYYVMSLAGKNYVTFNIVL